MKVLIFLVLAIGLLSTDTTGYPSNINSSNRLESQRFDIFGAVTKIIDQLVKTVEKKLNDLMNQTASIFLEGLLNIENAVNLAISSFIFQIQNVQTQLSELIDDKILPCLSGLQEDINKVQNTTFTDILTCYYNSKNELEAIHDYIINYQETNSNEAQAIREKIEDCMNESYSFGDKLKCAVDASQEIRKGIEHLAQNIDNTAKGIFETIYNSINVAYLCIDDALINGQVKLDEIIENVVECLESEETSTSEEPSTISTSEEPSTISTTDEPSTISTSEDPSTISTSEDPSTISTSEEPSTISTSEDPFTISTSEDPSTISTSEDPSTISTSEDPSTISTSEDPSTISTTEVINHDSSGNDAKK